MIQLTSKYLTDESAAYIISDKKQINDINLSKPEIDFAKKMNIQTIAEFVHSQSVFDMVKSMGIDFAQGYFFGKPQKLD